MSFTNCSNSVDTEEIIIQNFTSLIKIINMVRNCKYIKKLGLTELFNSFYDEADKFDYSRLNEFFKEFREKVPLSDYQDYKDLIDEIFSKGEKDVLLPGLPKFFALSSGTISGKGKMFPIYWYNFSFLENFRGFPNESIVNWVNQAGFKNFNKSSKGIGLFTRYIKSFSLVNDLPICPFSSILPNLLNDIEPDFVKNETDYRNRILTGLVFSAAYADLEFIFSLFLITVVDFFTIFEEEFLNICNHIENGTLPISARLSHDSIFYNNKKLVEIGIKPNKLRADELRRLIINDSAKVSLKGKINLIWPKLSLIYGVHSGPMEPALNICKLYSPNTLYMNSFYASSEGIHAIGVPLGKNHYCLMGPADSFLEFIPEDNSSEVILSSELKVDQVYQVIITSPLTGLLRYKLGDSVKMIGWFSNKPVISILGRSDFALRHPNYQIKESECISCFRELKLDMPFIFFFDLLNNAKPLGVFIEYTLESSDEKEMIREKISNDVHQYFKNNNEKYAFRYSGVVNGGINPVGVHFVRNGSFMEWTIFKAAQLGIKTTNQIKMPRVALSEELIQHFLQRVD